MTATQLQYSLNWNRIFGERTPQGNIFLLPSEACGVIVQYEPDFRISCLIPPTQRQVIVVWGENDTPKTINSPGLVLSHLIRKNTNSDAISQISGANVRAIEMGCVCRHCDRQRPLVEASQHSPMCSCELCARQDFRQSFLTQLYHLFAVDPDNESDIIAQPYRLTNVYEDGKMCFRKDGSDLYYPQNLRQAHSSFWMHKFDNDFNLAIPHECDSKIHYYRMCRKKRHQIHVCHSEPHAHEHTCTIDEFGNRTGSGGCNCCLGSCYCSDKCLCCMGTCDCHIQFPVECNCLCCRNQCNCRCSCDLAGLFADYVENYQPNPKKWENYTGFICGSKFFASNKRHTGVFVSQDKELMSIVPSKYWRTSDRHNTKFLLGVTKRLRSGAWQIDLGEVTFSLAPEQVRIVA